MKSLVIGVLIILLAAAAWWAFSPSLDMTSNTESDSTSQTSNTPSTSTNTSGGTSGGSTSGGSSVTSAPTKNTFRSVLTQQGNHECKYEQLDGTRNNSNVIYLSNGKMRGEFRTVGDVGDLMVYDGVNLYTWQEGKTTGRVTKITSIAQLPDAIPKDLTSAAIFGSASNNVSWDCHPWIPDAKLLVKPSYVTFQ